MDGHSPTLSHATPYGADRHPEHASDVYSTKCVFNEIFQLLLCYHYLWPAGISRALTISPIIRRLFRIFSLIANYRYNFSQFACYIGIQIFRALQGTKPNNMLVQHVGAIEKIILSV